MNTIVSTDRRRCRAILGCIRVPFALLATLAAAGTVQAQPNLAGMEWVLEARAWEGSGDFTGTMRLRITEWRNGRLKGEGNFRGLVRAGGEIAGYLNQANWEPFEGTYSAQELVIAADPPMRLRIQTDGGLSGTWSSDGFNLRVRTLQHGPRTRATISSNESQRRRLVAALAGVGGAVLGGTVIRRGRPGMPQVNDDKTDLTWDLRYTAMDNPPRR